MSRILRRPMFRGGSTETEEIYGVRIYKSKELQDKDTELRIIAYNKSKP